ncbi:relaxase/mobilization nuclease domain-containing protein [Iningainema tapete]|uniref:Relaxase/mobilization nuclease domain-containing protein n=1 Tax=Iningainema tapete BLCC-T55 TaxID=2748662 RepID=A0A8J6XI53_9CYAN|nr:relaxase/mobilization nuclease domain-containing protein [Iningainema tapete]MBD2770632.1 relaxase/mobilization nuclease domain-containing protein [Iningainema tapete BLCC-T55]
MIGKQKKGRGFRGLLDYLESSSGSQLIGGNMSGRNARELAREFKLSRQLNPGVERAVYHVSLSAAKSDRLDDEQWCEIADKYMEQMGFDCNQYSIIRHANTDDDHIHIVASRIRLDTALVVHDSWDYVRSEKVLRELEKEYGLTQVQGSREKLARRVSTGQTRRMMREQSEYESGLRQSPPELPIKMKLQQAIDDAVQDKPPMPLMIARLQLQGIEVRSGFTRTGKSKGISFQMQDLAFSGTHLGPGYTFNGITQRTEYEPQRDDPRIQQLVSNPNLAQQMLERYLTQQQQQQQQQTQQRKSRGIER